MPARPQPARRCGDLERSCAEVLKYFAAVLADRGQSPASISVADLLVGVTGFDAATSSSRSTPGGRRFLCPERGSFQDRPGAGTDLRRNSYSVRYSLLVRPRQSVRVSLAIAGVLTPTPSDAQLSMIRELARGLDPLTCCFSGGGVPCHGQRSVSRRMAWSGHRLHRRGFGRLGTPEGRFVGETVGANPATSRRATAGGTCLQGPGRRVRCRPLTPDQHRSKVAHVDARSGALLSALLSIDLCRGMAVVSLSCSGLPAGR